MHGPIQLDPVEPINAKLAEGEYAEEPPQVMVDQPFFKPTDEVVDHDVRIVAGCVRARAIVRPGLFEARFDRGNDAFKLHAARPFEKHDVTGYKQLGDLVGDILRPLRKSRDVIV